MSLPLSPAPMSRDEMIAALESALDDLLFRGGEDGARESIHAVLAALRATSEGTPQTAAPVSGCINCGETNDGGYETEEVGSFCEQCWNLLREHFAAALSAAPPAPTPPKFDPATAPFCRKHGTFKKAVAHYFCEDCAAAGEATVGPASAHDAAPAPTPLDVPEHVRQHSREVVDMYRGLLQREKVSKGTLAAMAIGLLERWLCGRMAPLEETDISSWQAPAPTPQDEEMADEYDFSKGVRGKYYAVSHTAKTIVHAAAPAPTPQTENICQCGHLREQHGAGDSPPCLVAGCGCKYFVLVVSRPMKDSPRLIDAVLADLHGTIASMPTQRLSGGKTLYVQRSTVLNSVEAAIEKRLAAPAPTPLVTRLLAVAMFSANRKTMLDAPCAWCGYNGQGYYQQGTHGQGCPWHMVGGMVERDALLPEIIAATYAAPAPTPNESLCGCGYRQSLHWVDETGAIYCQLAEARHRALAAERIVDEALLAWHPAAPALPPVEADKS